VDLVTLQQSSCKTPTKRTTRTTVINLPLTRIKGADLPPQCTMHTACRRTSGGRRVVSVRREHNYRLIIVARVVRGDGRASLIIPLLVVGVVASFSTIHLKKLLAYQIPIRQQLNNISHNKFLPHSVAKSTKLCQAVFVYDNR